MLKADIVSENSRKYESGVEIGDFRAHEESPSIALYGFSVRQLVDTGELSVFVAARAADSCSCSLTAVDSSSCSTSSVQIIEFNHFNGFGVLLCCWCSIRSRKPE